MSILLPNFIWVATGSNQNFKESILKPLKKRNCIAFPDNGEYSNWNSKAELLNSKGYRIFVSSRLEKRNLKNGHDLADIFN